MDRYVAGSSIQVDTGNGKVEQQLQDFLVPVQDTPSRFLQMGVPVRKFLRSRPSAEQFISEQ